MTIRYLKIVLVLSIALLCLMYATQNIVNLEAAHAAIAGVLSMHDNAVYPEAFGPAVTQPVLVWCAVITIITGEMIAGLLSLKGAWDLWTARGAPTEAFQSAKKFALIGGGLAMVVWFGLFGAIGGAYFQMWQTDVGSGSIRDAAFFVLQIGILLLFVNIRDESL